VRWDMASRTVPRPVTDRQPVGFTSMAHPPMPFSPRTAKTRWYETANSAGQAWAPFGASGKAQADFATA
jgi:hypothetical protein